MPDFNTYKCHICDLMLRPFINHSFQSPIWRLEIDSLNGIIFIEIRNTADKQVSFSSLSLNTGEVYFDGLQTEERWLTGIEAAYDGVLLLHNYQTESGPSHKAVIALEALSGKTLWNDFNSAFDHLTINGPIIYDTRMQPRKLLLADIKTGATIRSYEPSIDMELANEMVLPAAASGEFSLSLHLPVHPLENTIHYLDHNNLRIVSLHALTAGMLQQHLYIMDSENIVFEDLLNTDIQKLQPESFLLCKDKLIYLKNQSQLKVLNL
jgi:Domain of unknown function (DUF4905)